MGHAVRYVKVPVVVEEPFLDVAYFGNVFGDGLQIADIRSEGDSGLDGMSRHWSLFYRAILGDDQPEPSGSLLASRRPHPYQLNLMLSWRR
jgi:hypothetical protein